MVYTSPPIGDESRTAVDDKNAALIASGLGRDFGSRVAVQSISLRIKPGTIVGLVGPNGAGKTTTLAMLAGLLAPSRGQVIVQGQDLHQTGAPARAQLGYVPQELALYGELTARQNLSFFASLHGVPRTLLANRIDAALDFAGLKNRERDRVSQFSGGMQRRLNLAVALLHGPRILLLDEPTVGVDAQSRAHILKQVRALRDRDQMAIVYTSHYMEEVSALCDELHIVDEGRVVASGTVASLCKDRVGAGQSPGLALESVFLQLTGKALRDDA